MTGRPLSRSSRYQQRSLQNDETPLGYRNKNDGAPTNSNTSQSFDDRQIKLSASASFDKADYFLSSSSLNVDDDNIEDTKAARGQQVATHRSRRRGLSEGDGDDYYDYHMSLRDDRGFSNNDIFNDHNDDNQDDLSRAYAGLSQPYHGPLATKIALLRKQSSDIDSQLSSSNSHMTMVERRALLDQKVEIEKTLGLMIHPAVNSVVRKRDSMDMSLLEHRRLSGDYDSSTYDSSSNNHASCYSVSSHRKNSTGISNAYSAGIANGKGEATDSLKTFKTHNTSASSGFSAATSPTTGSYTGGRRRPIIGQVFRGGNVAFANSRADDDNNGFHDNTNLSDNDDDDNSFVGNLGSRNDTLRASDHLFLSDEIFTSPSLRCLSITSRESLKKLKHIKPVYDDNDDDDDSNDDRTSNKNPNDARGFGTDKTTMGGRLMTYDEYKAATTNPTANPTPDGLDALSKINQRRRTTMSFDAANASKASGGVARNAFVPPSEDAMEAFARINLRKARRETMAHGFSTTSDNIGGYHDDDPKPQNMKPGKGQSSSNVQVRELTAPSTAHGRRPSIWGGLLNTLSAEVAPLPQAGSHSTNSRSSNGPFSSQHARGDSSDLRNKKGRVYSM